MVYMDNLKGQTFTSIYIIIIYYYYSQAYIAVNT
jgi:hypothetical protein